MKTFAVALSFVLCLAAAALAAGDKFTADNPSPLKLARPAAGDGSAVRFTGTVGISGRFVAAWEGLNRSPRYLRVTFLPNEDSAALLPHVAGAAAVKELILSNNEEAATLLLGSDAAARLLAKEVMSAEGAATVTIGDYRTVVECDQRWYMARLITVTTSRDVVAAAGGGRRAGC